MRTGAAGVRSLSLPVLALVRLLKHFFPHYYCPITLFYRTFFHFILYLFLLFQRSLESLFLSSVLRGLTLVHCYHVFQELCCGIDCSASYRRCTDLFRLQPYQEYACIIKRTIEQNLTGLESCSPDNGQKEYTFSTDFTKDTSLNGWETAAGNVTFDDNGAAFTINQKGDAPTIDTKDYFFFGRVEVEMKAAPGTGVVSSIVMESDDLDEIDWVCTLRRH